VIPPTKCGSSHPPSSSQACCDLSRSRRYIFSWIGTDAAMIARNRLETLSTPNKIFGGKQTRIDSSSSVVSKTALRAASVVMLRVARREAEFSSSCATLRFCSGGLVMAQSSGGVRDQNSPWVLACHLLRESVSPKGRCSNPSIISVYLCVAETDHLEVRTTHIE
jgi:hypothetical protein